MLNVVSAQEMMEDYRDNILPNLLDKMVIDDEFVTFYRDGSEIYYLDRDQVKHDGIAWWINHLRSKIFFDSSNGFELIEMVRNHWGIK